MQFFKDVSRRQFLTQTGSGGALTSGAARAKDVAQLPISLAQWTINGSCARARLIISISPRSPRNGIHAVEYVNQFFMDKAKDAKYLGEMKARG